MDFFFPLPKKEKIIRMKKRSTPMISGALYYALLKFLFAQHSALKCCSCLFICM